MHRLGCLENRDEVGKQGGLLGRHQAGSRQSPVLRGVRGTGSHTRKAKWEERFPGKRAGVHGKQGCQNFPTDEEEVENRNSTVFINDWKLHRDEKGEDIGSRGH